MKCPSCSIEWSNKPESRPLALVHRVRVFVTCLCGKSFILEEKYMGAGVDHPLEAGWSITGEILIPSDYTPLRPATERFDLPKQ
jgi:hypothetical protein